MVRYRFENASNDFKINHAFANFCQWYDDFVFAGDTADEQFDEPDNPYEGVGASVGIEDDIPMDAIGFEDISDGDEFNNDEPLALDVPIPSSSIRTSANIQHLSMNSNTSRDSKFGSASLKARIPSGDVAAQSVSSGTMSVAYDRLSFERRIWLGELHARVLLKNFYAERVVAKFLNNEIWEGTVQIGPTEEFAHQTMDLCGQNLFRESNLYSLEIVAK
jgi:hypothetical protein